MQSPPESALQLLLPHSTQQIQPLMPESLLFCSKLNGETWYVVLICEVINYLFEFNHDLLLYVIGIESNIRIVCESSKAFNSLFTRSESVSSLVKFWNNRKVFTMHQTATNRVLWAGLYLSVEARTRPQSVRKGEDDIIPVILDGKKMNGPVWVACRPPLLHTEPIAWVDPFLSSNMNIQSLFWTSWSWPFDERTFTTSSQNSCRNSIFSRSSAAAALNCLRQTKLIEREERECTWRARENQNVNVNRTNLRCWWSVMYQKSSIFGVARSLTIRRRMESDFEAWGHHLYKLHSWT